MKRKVIFYNPLIDKIPCSKINDEIFLSQQGGMFVWSNLVCLYLKRIGLKCEVSNKIPEDESIVLFHPKAAKNILKLNFKKDNKIFVCTLADAKHKIKFADYHIVQNPYEEDKYSFFIPHFPQPGLIPRNKEIVDTVSYKGELQNLNEMFRSELFKKMLYTDGINYLIETDKNKWLDYSYVDIVLAVRPYDKKLWIRKPFTKILNAWIAQTPIIVGKEIANKFLRKSELDFFEVNNIYEAQTIIKQLKNDKKLYKDVIENGKERRKEFSIEKIVNLWKNVLYKIDKKGRNNSIITKIYKKIYL